MLHILALIAILSLNTNDDHMFLSLVRGIEGEKSIWDLIKKEQEIEALLRTPEVKSEAYQTHYLMILKSDICNMKRIGQQGDSNSVKEKLDIFLANNKFSKINPATNERIKELTAAHREMIVVFGEFSYVDFIIAADILVSKIISYPDKNFADDVDAEIKRFEGSSWKDSPMLNQLYMIKCRALMNAKCYGLAYEACMVAKKMREKICVDKSDPIHLGPASYEIQSLCFQEKYSDVISLYKKVPNELLESSDQKYLNSISRIYSSLAISYFESGKVELAITYQELALGKAYQCFADRDYPVVSEQAIKLRDILKKKGDLTAMRAIEERYNLRPTSNQPGEK